MPTPASHCLACTTSLLDTREGLTPEAANLAVRVGTKLDLKATHFCIVSYTTRMVRVCATTAAIVLPKQLGAL